MGQAGHSTWGIWQEPGGTTQGIQQGARGQVWGIWVGPGDTVFGVSGGSQCGSRASVYKKTIKTVQQCLVPSSEHPHAGRIDERVPSFMNPDGMCHNGVEDLALDLSMPIDVNRLMSIGKF